MSKNKPDYTKFMRKPAPLDPQPKPQSEAPAQPATGEIPWAEIVPTEEGEITFTDPGQIACFQRVDTAHESDARPQAATLGGRERAAAYRADKPPLQTPAAPAVIPAQPPEPTPPTSVAVQAAPLILYESVPPSPILACGFFVVILAFLAS